MIGRGARPPWESGRTRDAHPGLLDFAAAWKPKRTLLVGGDGIPLAEFLLQPAAHWFAT